MKRLEELITALENKISDYDLLNSEISQSSVGWHIEHSLLTINLIIDVLKKSNPADYKATFDLRRVVVLVLGKIPRGRVKAPAVVQPVGDFDAHALQQHVLRAKENLKSIADLGPGHFFKHPFLGDFKLKPAIRFLAVHTNHHLQIINDIVKSKR